MKKIRFITTLILAFTFVFAQVGNVMAAPAQAETTIDGTIQEMTCETTNGENTFVITLELTDGTTQTVHISEQTAIDLGLITPVNGNVDCTSDSVLQELLAAKDTDVQIPSDDVIPDEPAHPISALLAAFFEVEASEIDKMHETGFGFGVIAQALWMAKNLDSEITFSDILEAKKSGDYSGLFPEDTTVNIPTNWGQFKKMVSEKKNNLGSVVSGHADADDDVANPVIENGGGNGNGQGNGQGNGNGQGQGNGNGNGQGNGNDHGKGNKKPKP